MKRKKGPPAFVIEVQLDDKKYFATKVINTVGPKSGFQMRIWQLENGRLCKDPVFLSGYAGEDSLFLSLDFRKATRIRRKTKR